MEVGRCTVTSELAGQRLDRALAALTGCSRNQVQRWIREERVLLNGRTGNVSAVVAAGDELIYRPPPPATDDRVEPEEGPLDVVHEEADFLLVEKPHGLAVHPGAGRPAGTLVNRLLAAYPEIEGVGGPGRPGIVHRLDMDTSGLMVIARTDTGYRSLSRQFAERRVDKTYTAIVYGRAVAGRIEAPIGRDPRDRKRMTVHDGGRPAVTEYEVVATAAAPSHEALALLRISLLTGRTHQIRVHLKHAGHPLVGDPVYGEARWKGLQPAVRSAVRGLARPALHALRLSFDDPASGARRCFASRPADDLERLWAAVADGASARRLLG